MLILRVDRVRCSLFSPCDGYMHRMYLIEARSHYYYYYYGFETFIKSTNDHFRSCPVMFNNNNSEVENGRFESRFCILSCLQFNLRNDDLENGLLGYYEQL